MDNWLNSAFYSIDFGAFNAVNALAQVADGVLRPICELMAILGKSGIFFVVLSVIFLLFKRTRKTGLCMLFAIAIGGILTNVIIKNAVHRERPYTVSELKDFWAFVGSHVEGEYSFPSGHATVTTAAMTAIFLTCNKKWSWLGGIFVLIMAFSRIYLIVHYLTDVFAGILLGVCACLLARLINTIIYAIIEKNRDKKFCSFVLNADVLNLFKNA